MLPVAVPVSEAKTGVGAERTDGTIAASPGGDDLPALEAPPGLGEEAMPVDEVAIETAMVRLPAVAAGKQRAEPFVEEEADRFRPSCGDRSSPFGPAQTVQAVDVSTGDFYPAGPVAGDVVALVASGRTDFELDAYGLDGSLV